MSEPREQGGAARRPVHIMAEINRTRAEMDETLNAIEQRLTPGQLVDQGLDYLKNSGAREYAANLAGSVKTHPLPATLAGIGIAWLMAVGNKPAQPGSDANDSAGVGERMQSVKDSAGGTVQSAKEKLGGGMQSTKESLGSGVESAKESLGSGMQSAKERASQLGDSARQQLGRARENWDYMLREHPLVLGAVGLAIGAVAAAMAPRTRKEDEVMGATRDKLVDQAKQAGSEKIEQVKQAAGAVKEDATGGVKEGAAAATPKPAGGEQRPVQGNAQRGAPQGKSEPARVPRAGERRISPRAGEGRADRRGEPPDSAKWPASPTPPGI
jgi:ElaB/YqjD/DUF883 family membrane-anchored ribosome-binding protein